MHVQGAKKFACQNEALISPWAGVHRTWVVPMGNLLVLTRACFSHAVVPLRMPGDIFREGECPADFGGANFSAPWTTKGASRAEGEKFVGEKRKKFVAKREIFDTIFLGLKGVMDVALRGSVKDSHLRSLSEAKSRVILLP